jgi:tetratricopeptide (TPR) repeat protein
VAFRRDGRQLASASNDGTVKLWDVDSGREVRTLRGHTAAVRSVAFDPGGTRLASAGADGTVRLWDLSGGQELHTLRGHKGPVLSVAFHAGGRSLASSGTDGTVRLWDAATGQEMRVLRGHADQVPAVAFSPDGRRLASGGLDHMIKIWDLDSGQETLTLRGDGTIVYSVAFSPNGRWLASAGVGQEIQLWDAAADQGREQALREWTAAPEQVLAWHRHEAAACAEAREWAAAVWHLDRLIAAEPAAWPLRQRRGLAHMELSQWNRYQKACAELVARLDRAPDAERVNAVVWMCALGPDALRDFTLPLQRIEGVAGSEPGNYVYQNTLGAALYRAGRTGEAIQHLHKALELHGAGGTAWDHFFLALAHQRLGHEDEARHWLATGVRWLDRVSRGDFKDNWIPTPLAWKHRLQFQLLRVEAEKRVALERRRAEAELPVSSEERRP